MCYGWAVKLEVTICGRSLSFIVGQMVGRYARGSWLAVAADSAAPSLQQTRNGIYRAYALSLLVRYIIIITSNVPANAEGDDDGKNHRYAENHVFR